MSIAIIISGIVTGILLGVFGSGGSIITMPALLYLLNVEPKSAIAMSLGIVAITATITALQHWRHGNVNLKITAVFWPVWRGWNLCRCACWRYYASSHSTHYICSGDVCRRLENAQTCTKT